MLEPLNQDVLAGLPRGHFGAILADPPWNYVTYSERGGAVRLAALQGDDVRGNHGVAGR